MSASEALAEMSADRVTWGDGTEYINVKDAATFCESWLAAAIDGATEYVELVARIHEVYRHLEMDTPADRALHAKHVEIADKALDLARRRLAALSPGATEAQG